MENKLYSSPVFTLTEHDFIHDALVLMQTNFIKRIVVVKDKKPVGIVTERDINRFLENDNTKRALDEVPLKEIMKKGEDPEMNVPAFLKEKPNPRQQMGSDLGEPPEFLRRKKSPKFNPPEPLGEPPEWLTKRKKPSV